MGCLALESLSCIASSKPDSCNDSEILALGCEENNYIVVVALMFAAGTNRLP